MRSFAERVVKFLRAEDGPSAVEYAVILALIIVVCLGSVTLLGANATTTHTKVGTTLKGSGS